MWDLGVMHVVFSSIDPYETVVVCFEESHVFHPPSHLMHVRTCPLCDFLRGFLA